MSEKRGIFGRWEAAAKAGWSANEQCPSAGPPREHLVAHVLEMVSMEMVDHGVCAEVRSILPNEPSCWIRHMAEELWFVDSSDVFEIHAD